MKRATATRIRQDASALWSVHNLRQTVNAASEDDVTAGLAWYADAHAEAVRLADTYAVTPRQASAVIAALSPQIPWERNVQIAEDFISGADPHCHYSLCTERAARVLAEPDTDPLDILGGPKVRSFYRNIADPQRYGPVTIDRHAAACLAGKRTPDYLRDHPKFLDRTGAYRQAAAHFRTVAREHGVRPHELQAVAWLAHRRTGAGRAAALPQSTDTHPGF